MLTKKDLKNLTIRLKNLADEYLLLMEQEGEYTPDGEFFHGKAEGYLEARRDLLRLMLRLMGEEEEQDGQDD